MRTLNKWISISIGIIPIVNSLVLIYLFMLLPLNVKLIDILEYRIEVDITKLFHSIQLLSTILIISMVMFLINCIESLRLLLINKIYIFIIEYILIFLFFQELLFTFLYIVISIISLKFIRFFINPRSNIENLSGNMKDTHMGTDMKFFTGLLMINIGSILVVCFLLSFIVEINVIAILSYILISIVILIIRRENIYKLIASRRAYLIVITIPPLGILSLI